MSEFISAMTKLFSMCDNLTEKSINDFRNIQWSSHHSYHLKEKCFKSKTKMNIKRPKIKQTNKTSFLKQFKKSSIKSISLFNEHIIQ